MVHFHLTGGIEIPFQTILAINPFYWGENQQTLYEKDNGGKISAKSKFSDFFVL